MSEPDPTKITPRPAATVMLIDDRPDLQVLMMERHAKTVFAGGMWVFPGGSVDTIDGNGSWETRCANRTVLHANQLLETESGALAYYVAAIREAFEEAGILLAVHRDSGEKLRFHTPQTISRFDAYRTALNEGELELSRVLERERLLLDAGDMHYVARWITPVGPPKRFDARFFIARIPKLQTPAHDNLELVRSGWFRPNDILKAAAEERMVLMTPTLRMIRCLSFFDSADEVIASANANPDYQRVRVADNQELVLPGEAGYEHADQDIENGWVKLRPLQ